MLKWNKKLVLVKVEGTYGTDSVPVVGTDAMLARNVSVKPLRLTTDERDYVVPHFGSQGWLVAGKFIEIDFEVEVAGAGAAGSAAPYGICLKACQLAETLNAGVSAVYTPTTPLVAADVSASIYFNQGGKLFKALGCLGTVKVVLEAGKVPVYQFHFVGLVVVPTDTALAAITVTAFQKPLAVNNANTTPATLFAVAAKFRRIEIDMGNKIDYRNLPNSEAVRYLDRKSSANFVFEAEAVAFKDWWTTITAETKGALAVTQGTVAGNKVAFAAATVQLGEQSLANENGVAMESYPAALVPTAAGNDEFTITLT